MSGLEILKPHLTSQVKRAEIMYSTLDRVYSVQIPYLWLQLMNNKHVHHHVPRKFINILDVS